MDRPAGGNTGRLFLAFGGPVCADWISNCPLDRVLTYKNLIYLLNLQNCGHAMASFDGHSFCARCREKGKGKDTCVESPTTECKFCVLLTPEQKAQLATPSYKLKKEKRDAQKADISSTTSKDNKDGTLVDPSIVSVIGAVSDTASVSSPPSAVPEKKSKKDKPSSSKSKKTVEKSATDKKMEELDQKWSDRFHRLEALLMSKTFQPTFSSAVKVTPSHSPPLPKTMNPSSNRPHPSALARTPLLCISLPANSVWELCLQSTLDWASLLYCIRLISLPASSDPTFTDRNLHLSALCPTSLL